MNIVRTILKGLTLLVIVWSLLAIPGATAYFITGSSNWAVASYFLLAAGAFILALAYQVGSSLTSRSDSVIL